MLKRYIFHAAILFLASGCLSEPDDALHSVEDFAWMYFSTQDGLGENYISTIYEDRSGRVWLGHDNGGVTLYKKNEAIENFTTADGLLSNRTYCFYEDAQGTLFVGTAGGVNVLLAGEDEWKYLPDMEGTPVTAIQQDEQERYWFGTVEYGIIYFDGSYHQLFDNACDDCNIINTLLKDSNGNIWLGTRGGLKVYDGKTLSRFTGPSAPPGRILNIYEDDWHTLWITSYEGPTLTKYTEGKFQRVDLSGLNNPVITSMSNGKAGQIWMGTTPRGLLYYDGVVLRQKKPDRYIGNVQSLLTDSHGQVWVGTFEDGLARFRPQ